jgi:lipopolysaccharide export system permease protein
MSRIDLVVLRRICGGVGITVAVVFGLTALVVSLDVGRFQVLSAMGGPLLGLTGIVTSALRTTMSTLPVTVLIGTIVGALELQARREMTIIKATGVSIWRVVRAPVLAAIVLGLFVGGVGWSAVIQADRYLDITQSHGSALWIEQQGKDGPFILAAGNARSYGTALDQVTIWFTTGAHDRIVATSAKLESGLWELTSGTFYSADQPPKSFGSYKIPTTTSPGDMRVKLTSSRDLTLPELLAAVGAHISDPDLRAGAFTSLFGLFVLPGLLAGSVLMGFAFTSGYRRTNKYGGAVLYGIVLGFVVYVITELATRSGVAGILDPAFAAVGPAFVAIVIGLTVLLYKEDGRA